MDKDWIIYSSWKLIQFRKSPLKHRANNVEDTYGGKYMQFLLLNMRILIFDTRRDENREIVFWNFFFGAYPPASLFRFLISGFVLPI